MTRWNHCRGPLRLPGRHLSTQALIRGPARGNLSAFAPCGGAVDCTRTGPSSARMRSSSAAIVGLGRHCGPSAPTSDSPRSASRCRGAPGRLCYSAPDVSSSPVPRSCSRRDVRTAPFARGLATLTAYRGYARQGPTGARHYLLADCGECDNCTCEIDNWIEVQSRTARTSSFRNSDHRYEYEMAEYRSIMPHLYDRTVLLSNSDGREGPLKVIAAETFRAYSFWKECSVRHFYGGHGIGLVVPQRGHGFS
jgi:hypothetical protein